MRIVFLTRSSKTTLGSSGRTEQSENVLLPQRFIAIAAQVSNSQVIHHHQDEAGLAVILKRHAAHFHQQQQSERQACGLHVGAEILQEKSPTNVAFMAILVATLFNQLGHLLFKIVAN